MIFYCYFCTMELKIMGILNCTPDSFFVGSRVQAESDIARRAEQILREGGDIIDIGAYSTRPGATEVSEEEEMRRLRMALGVIRRNHADAVLSVDTFRASVACMAAEEYGVQIINDVSEGADPKMFSEVARLGLTYILMSVEPTMKKMIERFNHEVETLKSLGCHDIILDPGFGFGKDVVRGNYEVLRQLPELHAAFPNLSLLAGMSRKRMAWMPLGCTPESDAALNATTILNTMAVCGGADILRVHDVAVADSLRPIFSASSCNR